jgi:hypothetical protein
MVPIVQGGVPAITTSDTANLGTPGPTRGESTSAARATGGLQRPTWDRRDHLRGHAAGLGLGTTTIDADLPTFNVPRPDTSPRHDLVGTGSVTVSILGKDSASGKYRTLLAGAAVNHQHHRRLQGRGRRWRRSPR